MKIGQNLSPKRHQNVSKSDIGIESKLTTHISICLCIWSSFVVLLYPSGLKKFFKVSYVPWPIFVQLWFHQRSGSARKTTPLATDDKYFIHTDGEEVENEQSVIDGRMIYGQRKVIGAKGSFHGNIEIKFWLSSSQMTGFHCPALQNIKSGRNVLVASI